MGLRCCLRPKNLSRLAALPLIRSKGGTWPAPLDTPKDQRSRREMLCPVEGREFFVGQKVLARGCVIRFDLRQCFLCLHAPKPKRLANAVAVQRPQIATNNGETLALDDCLCGDPLATLADSLRKNGILIEAPVTVPAS
jgi:hypothetical protein